MFTLFYVLNSFNLFLSLAFIELSSNERKALVLTSLVDSLQRQQNDNVEGKG